MRGLTLAVVAAASLGSAAQGQMTVDPDDFQNLYELWSSPNTITGGGALSSCIQAQRGGRTLIEPWACSTGCTFDDGSKFECDETDGALIGISQGPATATKLRLEGNLPLPALLDLPLTTLWLPPQDNRNLVATEYDEDNCIRKPMGANWYTDPRAFCGWQGGDQAGLIFGGFYAEILGEGSARWCFQNKAPRSIVTCEAAAPKLPTTLVFPANANEIAFDEAAQDELNEILHTFGSSLVNIDMSGWTNVVSVSRSGRNTDCLKVPKCLLDGVTCTLPANAELCPAELSVCSSHDTEDDCTADVAADDCFWDADKANCKYKLSCADIAVDSEYCDRNGLGTKKTRTFACKGKQLFKTCRINLFEQCNWDNRRGVKSCVNSETSCNACNSEELLSNKQVKRCCLSKKSGNRWACAFSNALVKGDKGSCAVRGPSRTVPSLENAP